MEEVKGEVALWGRVAGSVWKKRVCMCVCAPMCPPPLVQAAVCLAQLELSSDLRARFTTSQ